jgi:hypothetical protein
MTTILPHREVYSILFDNYKLDSIRVLYIIKALKLKKVDIRTLTIYYSVIVSEYSINEKNQKLRYDITNLYLDIQVKIKSIIIDLYNQNLIDIITGSYTTLDKMKLSVKNGLKGIENDLFNDTYFSFVSEKVSNIRKAYPKIRDLEKIIFEGEYNEK